MKKLVVLAAGAMLSACAMVESAKSPGSPADFAISCPAGHLEICFSKAREVCPTGYTVVSMRRPDSIILPTVFQDQIVVDCN